MQCNIDKNSLRMQMKAKRKELNKEEIESKSRAICAAFASLESFSAAKTVCVYMDAFNEVKTSYIIEECKKYTKDIVVPVVSGDDIYLSPFSAELEKGAFGIWEPADKQVFPKEKVDIFAVPALVFDFSGARVGFGKGYYDKLLKNTEGAKVGLCYEFQLKDSICREEHDILMDYIISERRVICCAEG